MSSGAKFRWSQVFAQWSLGITVSTPLIALLQGSILLSDYRLNFRDAPRPIMPASGVTVALGSERSISCQQESINAQDRPLRLLVVGDSLAAGVGISKSGIPVLPESIARALSKAFGGRAVYWTCVGTPGISASQIVHDINNMQSREPRRLEKFLREWQVRRKKWKQLQDWKLEHRRKNISNDDDYGNEKETLNSFMRILWDSGEKLPLSEIGESLGRITRNRWKRTIARVMKDLSEFKDVILGESTYASNGEEEDVDPSSHENAQKLVRKGNIFRRNSLDPVVASQYDIAVVLLGLNDLKDAFMPHMTMGANASTGERTETINGGLNHQLQGVLRALQKKMGRMDLTSNDDHSFSVESRRENVKSIERLKPPLVVVPELPVVLLDAFQLVPLCWFLVPLFRAMESNKKFLSATFPEHVVFVQQPDLKWWSEVEAGISPIHKNLKEEESLLRLTDIAQTAQKKVQGLMRQFYNPDNHDAKESERRSINTIAPARISSQNDGRHEQSHYPRAEIGIQHDVDQDTKGASFVGPDKVHPNDEGYEIWGHHIAAAVVRRWNRRHR